MLRLCAVLCFFFFGVVVRAQDGLSGLSWTNIEEAARGKTVRFYLWGGDERINTYVSSYIAGRARDEHGIMIERVGLTDTAEAVNQILFEKAAGVTDDGAVDLLWVNGENFRSLKESGLLFCDWAGFLPNIALTNIKDPALAYDFGTPVEGCEAPWSFAQFAFAYDSARIAEPPRTIPALMEWIKKNPGRFTYAAPPDFNGSAFVRHVFYSVAGGHDQLVGPYDPQKFSVIAAKTWALLNEIEPFLWRQGKTYPLSIVQLDQLYANREVDFTFNYEPTRFGANVMNGSFPDTTRSYALDDGTLANASFVAIPFNSADKHAAMVIANLLLDPKAQREKADPQVWGMPTVLDINRLAPEDAASFQAIPRHPSVVSDQELVLRARPELHADWIEAIEQGWIENVGR